MPEVQSKFNIGDLVKVGDKVGSVVQYRSGDGRTTVGFVKIDGENAWVHREQFAETEVEKLVFSVPCSKPETVVEADA